jgi:LytS/YehU family sensor histidine kinase
MLFVQVFMSHIAWNCKREDSGIKQLNPSGSSILVATLLLILAADYVWGRFYLNFNPPEVAKNFLVTIGAAFALGHIRALIIASKEKEDAAKVSAMESRRETVEANLRLLAGQIHPHFLFNVMASTVAWIQLDPERAEKCLVSTSNYCRYLADVMHRQTITLAEERGLTEDYLKLIKIRMDGELRTRIDWDPRFDDLQIPYLLVQPLVENAVKHGLEPRKGGDLHISVDVEGDFLNIRVRNNGIPLNTDKPKKSQGGVGLSNLRNRLQLAYGPKARFKMLQEGDWVTAFIQIPQTMCV